MKNAGNVTSDGIEPLLKSVTSALDDANSNLQAIPAGSEAVKRQSGDELADLVATIITVRKFL